MHVHISAGKSCTYCLIAQTADVRGAWHMHPLTKIQRQVQLGTSKLWFLTADNPWGDHCGIPPFAALYAQASGGYSSANLKAKHCTRTIGGLARGKAPSKHGVSY